MGKKKTLREQASDLADTLTPHVEHAREKAAPVLADAKAKAAPVLADARSKAAPVLADARDKATPYLSDARDKATPYLSEARDMAAPVLDRFTSEVLPVLTAALAAIDSATEDARTVTKERGKAVAAALKGEDPEPVKKRRGRRLLVILGLGGVAFALAKKLGKRQPTTNWQSAYSPPPTPTSAPAGGPVADGAHRAGAAEDTDDIGASDPAEAAADATDVPHDATTPDNPVTEVNLDKR